MSPRAIDHQIEAGTLEILHPTVYRIAGAPPSWDQAIRAALFGAGEDSLLSHLAAGVFWRLEGVVAERPHILLTHDRRLTLDGVVVHRTRVLPEKDHTTRRGMRLTSVARTLVDIAGLVSFDVLEGALDDALRRRIVTLDQLRACLDARGPNGVKGWGRISKLVDERVGNKPTGSGKETVFLRGLRNRGLPRPTPQYTITDGAGRFVARVDFAYPGIKLVIEVDGRHHMDPRHWRSDLARQNRMVLGDWRFLRFPKTDRAGQREAFATIEAAFAAFGELERRDPSSGFPKRTKRGRPHGSRSQGPRSRS